MVKSFRFIVGVSLLLLESSVARPFGIPPSTIGTTAAFARKRTSPAISESSRLLLPLRGGATFDDHHENDNNNKNNNNYMPPRISAQDMALALRWTGEINRRLHAGTQTPRDDVATQLLASNAAGKRASEQSPLLTLFHAKHARPTGHGANRWGPALEAYVAHICRQLTLSEEAAPELSLALVYLDRATSVETPRSNGVPPVPFLQPRTVHRLVLAAVLLATHTTQGSPLPVLMERVESLGVPPEHLSHMLQWMMGALGDPGYFVTHHSLQTWRNILTQTSRLRELLQEDEEENQEDEEENTIATTQAVVPSVQRSNTRVTESARETVGKIADSAPRARLEAA